LPRATVKFTTRPERWKRVVWS